MRTNTFFLLLISIVVVIGLSHSSNVNKRVFHGTLIKDWSKFNYKYVVGVLGADLCSGVVVSATKVLTAAKCVCLKGKDAKYVVFGSAELKSKKNSIKVKSSTFNEEYKVWCRLGMFRASAYDVGMITLEHAVDMKKFDTTIAPLSFDNSPRTRLDIFFFGYGSKDDEMKDEGILRMGRSKLCDCPKSAGKETLCGCTTRQFYSEHLTAGDAGGPMIYSDEFVGKKDVFVAINSGHISCSRSEGCDIFAPLKSNKDFIKNNL